MLCLITWEEPYKYKPYKGNPTRFTLDGSKLSFVFLDKLGGNPISIDFTQYTSAKGLPEIKSYCGEEHTDKYNKMNIFLDILIEAGLNSQGIARDLCCFGSDTQNSTAGLLLSIGFTVFAYGNNINNIKQQPKLTYCLNPDITKSQFVGKTSLNSLGKMADVSIMDACGIQDTHPPFMENVVKHSKVSLWFLSSGCGRPMSIYKNPKYTIYGHPYPTGKGALTNLVYIIMNNFKDIGYNSYHMKTNHGDHIIAITKLKISNKYISNKEQ